MLQVFGETCGDRRLSVLWGVASSRSFCFAPAHCGLRIGARSPRPQLHRTRRRTRGASAFTFFCSLFLALRVESCGILYLATIFALACSCVIVPTYRGKTCIL